MNQSDINFLDLPNEMLLIILKKLDNIDVLYSLFGINNKRLDILVQDGVFTNNLNFVTTSLITDEKFDRFCTYILPRSHHCVKKLILEATSMERILLAGDYPNLTYLELFNFKQEKVFHYFAALCINMTHIDDCLSILDGRLKQLTTFIVQINCISDSPLISRNMDELHSLKYFSLTCYEYFYNYDDVVVPLLRRMTHLEKLTLYLRVRNRSSFVNGTHLHNEILVHMPQLHTFIFYISTENNINESVHRISNDDIQQTFTHTRYARTVIEYSHLISLDITSVYLDYVAQFLLETKAHLPRLTELKVSYDQLKMVTMNFTRDATRRNCSKVKRLIVEESTVFSKDVYQYFPSL
ncbi:unnamed protein product [Rotaria socialis]|uniref:F-box domain-containing protein n=1 Tax=Rotaria socialis TaxID=392032 RepID=A0A818BBN4_9BILA|nr:unnamed protein product [Rotaria socialis]